MNFLFIDGTKSSYIDPVKYTGYIIIRLQ